MPLSVETEPLVETQQGLKDGEIALVGVAYEPHPDDSPEFVAEHAGPITPEELRDGATAIVEDAVGDAAENEPGTPQVDYDDQPAAETATEAVAEVPADPPPTSPATPATAPIDDAAHILARIAAAEAEVREAESRIAEIKGELKDAKEDYEAAINRLCRLSRQSANDSKRPLLAVAENASKNGKAVVAGADSPANQEAAGGDSDAPAASAASSGDAANDPDAWRAIRLDDQNYFPSLAGQKGLLGKLAENDIETIGQMVDFQSTKNGSKDITDIKGVGSVKAEKISDALETFWREHPEMNFDAAVEAS